MQLVIRRRRLVPVAVCSALWQMRRWRGQLRSGNGAIAAPIYPSSAFPVSAIAHIALTPGSSQAIWVVFCVSLRAVGFYINSSIKARLTSAGICESACTRGPAFSTGSAPCRVGRSVRSKNFPIGISSSQSRDFLIAAIQSAGSYAGSSSSFFTRGRNH